jgi:UDPglucose--hexose-1-phosphate uridylyltransferase
MQETRYDWLEDRWVLFAPNREQRPNEYSCKANEYSCNERVPVSNLETCPFCAGFEQSTPSPSLVLPLSDLESTTILRRDEVSQNIERARGKWKVRVVPNKYPAVQTRATVTDRSQLAALARGSESFSYFPDHPSVDGTRGESDLMIAAPELFRKEIPSGVHEVIIESPEHDHSLSELSISHVELVFQAYKMRLQHFRSKQDIVHAIIFKNYGPDAGASLSHSHSQLVGLGFVPSEVSRRNQRLLEYFDKHESCYYCQIAAEEERLGDRLVISSAHFIVYTPFAARFPYEFTVHPKTHRSHFDELNRAELKDLASVMKLTLGAIEKTQPQLSYNMILNTSPFNNSHPLANHWNIQVLPRSARIAGFELGTDCFINTVKPEFAAAVLRSAI